MVYIFFCEIFFFHFKKTFDKETLNEASKTRASKIRVKVFITKKKNFNWFFLWCCSLKIKLVFKIFKRVFLVIVYGTLFQKLRSIPMIFCNNWFWSKETSLVAHYVCLKLKQNRNFHTSFSQDWENTLKVFQLILSQDWKSSTLLIHH